MSDISAGRQLIAEQEREMMRKSIDQLYTRMHEIEMSGGAGAATVAAGSRGMGMQDTDWVRGIEERIIN